jgi:hypothetical protein
MVNAAPGFTVPGSTEITTGTELMVRVMLVFETPLAVVTWIARPLPPA